MKTATNARVQAARIFNPKNLCQHLIKTNDDVVIVDRTKIIKAVDDNRLFAIVLNADYGWDYSDYENSTIYFQVEDNCIIGGVYNVKTQTKVTRRKIASAACNGLTRQYVYSPSVLDELCRIVNNA